MENQKILNTPVLLAALVELLNLQQLEISELMDEGNHQEAKKLQVEYRQLLSKTTQIAKETVSTLGQCLPVNTQNLTLAFPKNNLKDEESTERVIKQVKVTDSMKYENPAKKSYSKVYQQDQVKSRMSDFSTKKNLSPEDLLKDDKESSALAKLVRRSISHMLQLGKRLEAVDYLTKYIFVYLGYTPDEAHKLINQMKDKFGIIEISKLRPINKKRDIPKGKVIYAEFDSIKSSKENSITTGYIIWPENCKNNSVFDYVRDEFVALKPNVHKFREVSPAEFEEIEKKRGKFIDDIIKKTRKRVQKLREIEKENK